MRLLCVIYGIGRGLERSAYSINEKLLKPLVSLGIELDTIYVLNEIKFVDNPRSGDFGELQAVPSDIFLDAEVLRTSKDQLLDQCLFGAVKKHKDSHFDNYKSYENLLCQLGMLKEAALKRDFFSYDRILMLRDDLFILNLPADLKKILNLSKYGLITTMWHWHGGVGERFSLSTPEIAFDLANRLDLVQEFIDSRGYLNGEHLQRFVLERKRVRILAVNLKLVRVRLHNEVKENFILPLWRPLELMRVLSALLKFWFLSFTKKKEI